MAKKRFTTELIERPGLYYSDTQLTTLVAELRAVAASCFDDDIPDYQCLEGSRRELADKVICVARDRRSGELLGFSSAVLLPVLGVGDVLHLGLTCVSPDARGGGLTRRLASRLVISYLLRHRLFSKVWVSNLACVLSSLGNVALGFDDVYPSPYYQRRPSDEQQLIAKAIDERYRKKTYINADAIFDEELFVFRGSVRNTMFQKREDDTRYYHRSTELNGFYRDLMLFEQGDEVLQVGCFSLLSVLRYSFGWRRRVAAKPAALPGLAEEPRRLPQHGA